MDTLIAYFSRAGENYSGVGLEELTKGNTEVVAEIINQTINSDLFKIEPINDYPHSYKECSETALSERKLKLEPPLKRYLSSIVDYKIIYLGYPIWWGTYPMPVKTFLRHYDFSDKLIVPFCTNQGTGIRESIADLNALLPSSFIDSEPLELKGHGIKIYERKIIDWVKSKSNH